MLAPILTAMVQVPPPVSVKRDWVKNSKCVSMKCSPDADNMDVIKAQSPEVRVSQVIDDLNINDGILELEKWVPLVIDDLNISDYGCPSHLRDVMQDTICQGGWASRVTDLYIPEKFAIIRQEKRATRHLSGSVICPFTTSQFSCTATRFSSFSTAKQLCTSVVPKLQTPHARCSGGCSYNNLGWRGGNSGVSSYCHGNGGCSNGSNNNVVGGHVHCCNGGYSCGNVGWSVGCRNSGVGSRGHGCNGGYCCGKVGCNSSNGSWSGSCGNSGVGGRGEICNGGCSCGNLGGSRGNGCWNRGCGDVGGHGDGGSGGWSGGSGGWSGGNSSNDNSHSSPLTDFGPTVALLSYWRSQQFSFEDLMRMLMFISGYILLRMARLPDFGLSEVFRTFKVVLAYLQTSTATGSSQFLHSVFPGRPSSHMFRPLPYGSVSQFGTCASGLFAAWLIRTVFSGSQIVTRKKGKAPPRVRCLSSDFNCQMAKGKRNKARKRVRRMSSNLRYHLPEKRLPPLQRAAGAMKAFVTIFENLRSGSL